MPKEKAIFIPKWVKDRVKDPEACKLLTYLPFMMHWRGVDYMASALQIYTANTGVRQQMEVVVKEIVQKLTEGVKSHPVVARISLSQQLPNELIVVFALDVHCPDKTGNLALRLGDKGDIQGISRSYAMHYDTAK